MSDIMIETDCEYRCALCAFVVQRPEQETTTPSLYAFWDHFSQAHPEAYAALPPPVA